MDRDSLFHAAFRGLLENAGVRPVRTPARSPNCNARLERFHGVQEKAAERMIFLGEDHLQRATAEYLEYYYRERNHQRLAGRLIDPGAEIGSSNREIRRRQRLDGMLNLGQDGLALCYLCHSLTLAATRNSFPSFDNQPEIQ